MKPKSVFVVEGPVPPELFFDRLEELDVLKKPLRVKRKVLIAVIGPFKFGKSSMLIKYFDILRNKEFTIPVLVDLNIVTEPISRIILAALSALEGKKRGGRHSRAPEERKA